jgi:hypothetical protein
LKKRRRNAGKAVGAETKKGREDSIRDRRPAGWRRREEQKNRKRRQKEAGGEDARRTDKEETA